VPAHEQVKKGDELDDLRYTIIRKLGSGTFGSVYCAVDKESGTYVAVKMQKSGRK
jgi:serine/threonine protein kinase